MPNPHNFRWESALDKRTNLFQYLHFHYIPKLLPFVQYLRLEVFLEKIRLSHLKTLKTVVIETKVCHVMKLWTNFQKIKQEGVSRRGTWFSKGGTMCPLAIYKPKGLDGIGLLLPGLLKTVSMWLSSLWVPSIPIPWHILTIWASIACLHACLKSSK